MKPKVRRPPSEVAADFLARQLDYSRSHKQRMEEVKAQTRHDEANWFKPKIDQKSRDLAEKRMPFEELVTKQFKDEKEARLKAEEAAHKQPPPPKPLSFDDVQRKEEHQQRIYRFYRRNVEWQVKKDAKNFAEHLMKKVINEQ